MFKKWFGNKEEATPSVQIPEIMGLRMGGAFELDTLKLKLIEPELILEGIAKTHLIQAVGEVKLDENSTLLRYYTDDDAFLEVLLTGGMTENHVADVKLWYFYDTRSIGSENDWNHVLDNVISEKTKSLEGHHFVRVWEGVSDASPPVAMTEKTYSENGESSITDQFVMLYEREINKDLYEYSALVAEEKIIDNIADRCLVTSTGFDIQPADIHIVG